MSTIDNALEILENKRITIHQERCVRIRNRNAGCRRCFEACPRKAFVYDDGTLGIDATLCVDCAICTTVCPTSALEAQQPSDDELLKKASLVFKAEGVLPVFACKPYLEAFRGTYDKRKVIEVECLGRLEESTVIALTILGAQQVLFVSGTCKECSLILGRGVSDMVEETLSVLFDAWDYETPLVTSTTLPDFVTTTASNAALPDNGEGLSRRDFFTLLKTEAQGITAQAISDTMRIPAPVPQTPQKTVVKVMQDGTLPHFINKRRERLLDYLDHFGDVQKDFINTRLWGTLSIDHALCSSCRMCATFCPTGAITKYDDPVTTGTDKPMGIEHYPAACVQCRLCEDICLTKAVHIDSNVSTKALLEGEILRYPMKPLSIRLNQPDQIYRRMYDLLGGGQIYDYGGDNSRPE